MDIGLLSKFSSILVFLLVFAVGYAIIKKTKILGESGSMAALVAFVIAIFIALNNSITAFLGFILPWFFILIFILIFLIFVGKLFGKTDQDIAWAFNWKEKNTPAVTWIIIISIIILIAGLSNLFGQGLLDQGKGVDSERPADVIEFDEEGNQISVASEDYNSSVMATLAHPKVLGVIVILLIGLCAILLLTTSGF